MLFKLIINDGSKCTLSKFGGDPKLGGRVNTPDVCCHSEGLLQAGEMGKCKPHEGQQNRNSKSCLSIGISTSTSTQGAGQLESSSAEKDLGVLVNELNMSQ